MTVHPQSNNFVVTDDGGTCTQYRPAIAVDPNLNFVVTWLDRRNGFTWDIYAQRFSNDGIALGNNFKVNEEPGNEEQEHPGISIDSSGNFVIVWADEKSGDWDIYGQRYSADGTALGGNFKINDDIGYELQYWPASTGYKNGNFIVSWVDKRYNDDYDIYAQRFLSDGTALGNNFKVNTDAGIFIQLRPDITIEENGNFIITWEDKRGGNWDVFAQRYLSDGTTLGENFKINDDTPATDQRNPSISADLAGNFVVCWEDDRNEYQDIYAQRFANDATPLGINFQVNIDTVNSYQYYSEISADEIGNFLITWEDHRFGFNGDIFAQSYLYDGTAVDVNYKVNDDAGSANQTGPSIAKDSNDNFMIAWVDHRNGYSDIYTQLFSSDGTTLGNNFKVNDDTSAYAIYGGPSIASDAAGNFVIAWDDYRNEYWGEIYAQRFSNDGTALGPNFKVNNLGASVVYGATVACKKNGDFIIVWGDAEDGGKDQLHFRHLIDRKGLKFDLLIENKGSEPDIWAQQYLSDGTALGGNFKVNDDVGNTEQTFPAIAIDSSGNFFIAWEDNRNGDWDIYVQRYLSDGTPLDSNFKVEDSVFSDNQRLPSISSDETGNFIISWIDKRNGNYDVYAQRYSYNGTAMGYNFQVNDDIGSTFQSTPCISVEANGNFVITWLDRRNGNNDVFAQRYLSGGIPYGINYRITNTDEMKQLRPSVVLDNNRIFSTWQDNRGGQTGYDIWANVLDWDSWVGFEEKLHVNIPSDQWLSQNYPNPCRSSTTIKFDLPWPANVTIEIFNHLGIEIETLLNDAMLSGSHEVEFNCNNLQAGIYLYRFVATSPDNEVNFQQVKKMVILQ